MAEYIVIHTFVDIQDHHHVYHTGDYFPRDGVTVARNRLAYLASDKTRMKKPVIKKVAVEEIKQTDNADSVAQSSKQKKGRRKKDADQNL